MSPASRPGRSLAAVLSVSILSLLAPPAPAGPITVHVTAKDGTPLEDAAVIFDPLEGAAPPHAQTAVIDQVNKRFVPRVSLIRSGTSVTFPNSDHIRHQVYSFSPAKTFTLKLYAGTPPTAVVFDRPGLVVLGCNIHDTMVGFVGVVDTPYFAKTQASGVATVDLPAGRYRVRLWHAAAAAAVPSQSITVGADPSRLAVVIDVGDSPAQTPAWQD